MSTLRPQLAPYSEYKPSCIDWLGDIPSHWDSVRLAQVLCRNDSGVWGQDGEPGDTPVLRSTEQTVDGHWKVSAPAFRKLTSSERAKGLLKLDDIVITTSSGSSAHIGKSSIVTLEMERDGYGFSNFMQRLRLSGKMLPRLAWYWLNNQIGREQFDYLSSTTTGLANLNGKLIASLRIALPPLDEQRAIADYLDRMDEKITRFIESRRRMITLLEEKKQVIINQAVTRGLDPSVPMKASGVEWLGEIPAHWEVRRLRTLSNGRANSFTDGDWIEVPFIQSEGIRLIQTGNVRRGHYREQGYRYISEKTFTDLRCKEVHPGDVLICRLADPVSRACLAPDLGVRMITSVDNCMLKTSADVSALFVTYCLNSDNYLDWVAAQVRGSTRDRVSRKMLGAFPMPAPPLDEQRAIAERLGQFELHDARQKDRLVREIDLLQEYRTRLISDVVTGKVRVC